MAPLALRAPHNAADCLDDLTGQLQRGVRICMDAAVAKQLMHGTYGARPRGFRTRTFVFSCGWMLLKCAESVQSTRTTPPSSSGTREKSTPVGTAMRWLLPEKT